MELKVRENNHGRYVKIHANQFEDGIEFAKKNNCNEIQLTGPLGQSIDAIDFKPLDLVKEQLTDISFYGFKDVKKIDSFDAIYSLKKLKRISIQEKQSFKIDLSRFPSLTELGSEYWKGLEHLTECNNLIKLTLTKYTGKDLKEFTQLKKLAVLHLYSSKTETLSGVDKIIELKELNLTRDTALASLEGINHANKLQKLHIEKCKLLTDYAILKKNKTISDLFIDNLDSIDFVASMTALEKITFWDCKDGDMAPLLKVPRLKEVAFYPNRKHYTHTKEQINELIKKR